ncbi:MAG: putative metal-binding motif-containing protein, partial [Marmoricola sp.]|nr:putative metal-binding motif-containing protein [Marmoricola sp.]
MPTRRTRTTAASALLVLPLVVAGTSVSPAEATVHPGARTARPAVRVVGARMLDVDHDDRADHLVLTWSAPINHATDTDGSYPFVVSGYVVRGVARAHRSRTLTLVLAEHSKPDLEARPTVRYVPTRKGAVKDLRRKQASGATFAGTVRLDLDGDGYGARDCGPTQAWVHPGAPDKPDAGLVDSNCDGIDGQRTGPVFVSPLGSDS